jgi:c-di-GMP-binding flagellar brake protein YcgR
MVTSEEGRAFARKKIEAELKCGITIVKNIFLLDISQSGALIRSHENLKIGNEYSMHFKCQEIGSFSINAKVIRCDLVYPKTEGTNVGVPAYMVGLEFIDIDKDKLQQISALIAAEEQSGA